MYRGGTARRGKCQRGHHLNETSNELTPASNVSSAGAFTATSGNVDIVGAANNFGFLCAAPESTICVDLDGNTQGTLSAPVTLMAGVTYALTFNLIGSGRGNTTSTTVTLDSLYNQTFILSSNDVTSGIQINHMVTSPTTINTNLVFASNTPGAIGAVLDDVTLSTAMTSSSAPRWERPSPPARC